MLVHFFHLILEYQQYTLHLGISTIHFTSWNINNTLYILEYQQYTLPFIIKWIWCITDLAILGRFDNTKTRSLLVKLPSIWEVRKALANKINLKTFKQETIYIKGALSPSDRLREKAKLK